MTTGFQTPSGNIVCNAGPASSAPHARPLLACTVLSEATAARGQKVWSLFATGRPLVGFIMGNAATDVPALAYGRLWRWRGFVCASRKAGLTCRSRAAHGFVLAVRSSTCSSDIRGVDSDESLGELLHDALREPVPREARKRLRRATVAVDDRVGA